MTPPRPGGVAPPAQVRRAVPVRPAAVLAACLLLAAAALHSLPAAGAPGAAGDSGTSGRPAAEELLVGPHGPYRSVQAAVDAAGPGAVIRLAPGVYRERVFVDRPVHLRGEPGAVLDGGGEGTILVLGTGAAGASVEGLTFRSSGRNLEREDGGVLVEAEGVRLESNRLEDVLFGFSLRQAHGTALIGNTVRGKPLPPSFRGDGIRLWHSHGVRVEGNVIEGARDILIWYSRETRFTSNLIAHGRYGLHYMYSEDSIFRNNHFFNNAVGSYVMFTRRIVLEGNIFEGSRDATGYGLAFKDADDITVARNLFVHNHAAIYLDNTPSVDGSQVRFEGNVIASNGLGMLWLSNVGPAAFTRNTFLGNTHAVRVEGGRQDRISWAEGATGNYWDDYAGFDLTGDGRGDVPHRIQRYVDLLTTEVPAARLLVHSPAFLALELAGRAVPLFEPRTLVEDPAPLMRPAVPAAFAGAGRPDAGLGAAAGALAAAGLGILILAASGRRWPTRTDGHRWPRPEMEGGAGP